MRNKFNFPLLFLNIKNILFSKDAFILTLFLFGAGLLSVWLEQDVTSDYQMYHYYNGFAFLNDRLTFDIAPAQIATYYNPLLDTLLYLADNTFSKTPYLFIMGLPAGLALFIVCKTAGLFFTKNRKIWIPASLLISLTGFAFFRQIGTCTHEITLACFILAALYILLKNPSKPVLYFISGALLGAAAGLKLTAALYCVSTGMTLLLFYKTLEKPKTFIGLFMLGGLTGFLAIDGFWMWTLWKNFQNPFFPFWNKIFRSPYFFDVNFVDDLHLSYDWEKLLFLPFLIFTGNTTEKPSRDIVANLSFSDGRWMIGYILLFVFAFSLLFPSFRRSVSKRIYFLTAFMVLSYLIWLFTSQNIRFMIPVEMLFGIMFLNALSFCPYPKNFFTEAMAGSVVFMLFLVLIATPLFSGRWGNYVRYSVPEDAVFPKNSLILTNGISNAYLAAKFAERTNARIINSFPIEGYAAFSDSNRFRELKQRIIKENFFPTIFFVTVQGYKEPEIEDSACYEISTSVEKDATEYWHTFTCSRPKIIKDIFHKTI